MHSKQSKSVFRFLRQLTPWHFPFWRLRAVLRLIAGPPTVQQSINISWVAARTHSSKPAATAAAWDELRRLYIGLDPAPHSMPPAVPIMQGGV